LELVEDFGRGEQVKRAAEPRAKPCMSESVVAQLMAGEVKLPGNSWVTQNVGAALEERGLNVLLIQEMSKMERLWTGAIVEGERDA
jgi:hypothetical protein